MKSFVHQARFLVAMLAGLSLGGRALAADTRVYVNFQPGQKAAAQGLVLQAQGTIHYEFDSLNAIATTLPEQALDALRRNPSIRFIEEDPPRYLFGQFPTVPYGIDLVQARDVWDLDRINGIDTGAPTGAGIKVGVIDSGVYTAHEDFAGVNLSGYAGNLPWDVDGAGHGTHVCGTIAAQLNSLGVVGVCPGTVSIYMVRVFGDSGSWAYSSTLLDAAQRCQMAGCRIISMSLGGGLKSRTEESGLNAIYNNGNGVLLVAAAGNGGNTQISYPAGYASVISVAALDASKVVAAFSQKNADVELAAPGVGVLSTVPFKDDSRVTVDGTTVYGTHIEFAAEGAATGPLIDGGLGDTIGLDWSGKVALIQRGVISFNDKIRNAQANGAVAAVIYNNVPGEFAGTMGSGNSSVIPGLGISDTDGTTLLAKLTLGTEVVSDLLAPASGYAAWDGTSMATPHVSAVAALVWSAVGTGKTAGQIRTALQSSAEDLGAAGRDTSYGYGLVRAQAAIAALGGGGGGGGNDTTPPVISNVGAVKVDTKRGTFKITWTTDEASTTQVTINGQSSVNNTLVTSHSMSFQGTKGATYTYYVSSTDAAGNTGSAGPFTHQN